MGIKDDLITCGRVASKFWAWRKVFYYIKDYILREYGTFDGYDLQVWCDEDWMDEENYAVHYHILERWVFESNVFHRPTDQYSYFNFVHQNGKQSPAYAELYTQVKNTIEGKKKYLGTQVALNSAFSALKRLVKFYRRQLRFQEP